MGTTLVDGPLDPDYTLADMLGDLSDMLEEMGADVQAAFPAAEEAPTPGQPEHDSMETDSLESIESL
eukprot:14722171-Alexandrium_andersonii.AAC.1